MTTAVTLNPGESITVSAAALPSPPSTDMPLLLGYGSKALSWLTSSTPVTVVGNNADYLAAYARLGDTVHVLRFTPGATIDLDNGSQIRKLTGRGQFLIDFRGATVTLKGGPIWLETCNNFALINPRHRGGWDGGQDADGFTIAGNSHDGAIVNASVSGTFDEGLSTTRGCWNITYQDVLWGPTGNLAHNYASLNDYGIHEMSIIRPTFIGLDGPEGYRCPKVGFAGDANTSPVATTLTADVVNRVNVDCSYGLTISSAARVNDTAPYTQNTKTPREIITGGKLVTDAVPLWAAVPAMTPTAAARYAKTNAGALPADAFDLALKARITA